MATTVGNFSAIDDTEVDAESPITETLVTRLRDNSYWIDPASTRTAETSTSLFLSPDGSGSTVWREAGVDGTKGTFSTWDTTWRTITTQTDGILKIDVQRVITGGTGNYGNINIVVDLSDDSFQSTYGNVYNSGTSSSEGVSSGTITTGSTVGNLINTGTTVIGFVIRRDSGNLQYRNATGSYLAYGSWFIL